MTGIAGHRERVAAVRAGVAQRVHLVGSDRAVLLHPGLHPHPHGMPRARADEFLFARILVAHGPPGSDGQVGWHVFHQDFLLAAKTAANARLDHADALDRQVQHRGQDAPGVERHLRAGANHQPVILIPIGHCHVRLDMRLLNLGYFILGFEDVVGFGKAFFHIADVDPNLRRQVVLRVRVCEVDVFRLVMQNGRARLHRFTRIQQPRQQLVLHVNQLQRLVSDLFCLRRHKCHPVAHEAHLIIQRERVQRPRDRVRLPGGRVDHTWNILVGQHCCYTGQRFGARGINAADSRVHDWAAQHLRHQHIAHAQIISEGGFALHQLDRVDFLLRLAHRAALRGFRRGPHLRHQPRAGFQARTAAPHGDGGITDWSMVRRAGFRRPTFYRLCARSRHPTVAGRQVDRRHVFAAQNRRSAQNGLHWFGVSRTAAQHTRKRLAHLVLAGVRRCLQQCLRCQHHSWRAVPALDRPALHEGLLDHAQALGLLPALVWVLAHALDGLDCVPFSLRRQHRARVDCLAVEQYRAGSTLAVLAAAKFRAKITFTPQHVQQRVRSIGVQLFHHAVNGQVDIHASPRIMRWTSRAAISMR